MQCNCMTLKGQRCSKPARKNGYCAQHSGCKNHATKRKPASVVKKGRKKAAAPPKKEMHCEGGVCYLTPLKKKPAAASGGGSAKAAQTVKRLLALNDSNPDEYDREVDHPGALKLSQVLEFPQRKLKARLLSWPPKVSGSTKLIVGQGLPLPKYGLLMDTPYSWFDKPNPSYSSYSKYLKNSHKGYACSGTGCDPVFEVL